MTLDELFALRKQVQKGSQQSWGQKGRAWASIAGTQSSVERCRNSEASLAL